MEEIRKHRDTWVVSKALYNMGQCAKWGVWRRPLYVTLKTLDGGRVSKFESFSPSPANISGLPEKGDFSRLNQLLRRRLINPRDFPEGQTQKRGEGKKKQMECDGRGTVPKGFGERR